MQNCEDLSPECFEAMESSTIPAVVFSDVSVIPEHEKDGLEQSISSLQVEISSLRLKERSLDGRRREALNKILDIKGSIRVFCRIRASLSVNTRNAHSPISTRGDKIIVRSSGGTRKEFGSDRVFSDEATQGDVFQEVEPILRSALDGHNVCIFAYGQTGTGKTFTMEGGSEELGVVPRSIEELFHQASRDEPTSFSFSVSMLEVYMGSIRDLLRYRHSSSRPIQSAHKCGLNILSSSNGAVEVEGLTDVPVADFKQACRWYSKGKRSRSTSWTNVNDASSRSHCLTRITIRRRHSQGNEAVSKLWMVDLGGSERLLKTGATGQTLEEGKAINLSLSALGDVIASLKMKRIHIPYRNSKLTQILSDSLGVGSKVLMIVHISPSEDDVGETICSLSFAKRVRAVDSNRELSEEVKNQKDKCISELSHQINEVEVELQKVKNQIECAEKLLLEKKKLWLMTYKAFEDEKESPRSPLIIINNEGGEESCATTEFKVSGKSHIRSSLPRFMTSTVASRQRLSANEGSGIRTTRTLRFGSRNAVELLTGSQSFSFSEPCIIKATSQRLRSKLVTCEGKSPTGKSTDLKSPAISRNKMVSTSNPNMRGVTLYRHRRRMSDLI